MNIQQKLEKTSFDWKEIKKLLPVVLPTAISLGGPLLAGATADWIAGRNEEKRRLALNENLNSSFSSILDSSPKLRANPILAKQRFDEMASISPTVAMNPLPAQKLLQTKLKTGFDAEDLMKLYQVEFHKQTTSTLPKPQSGVEKYLRNPSNITNVFRDAARSVENYYTPAPRAPRSTSSAPTKSQIEDAVRNSLEGEKMRESAYRFSRILSDVDPESIPTSLRTLLSQQDSDSKLENVADWMRNNSSEVIRLMQESKMKKQASILNLQSEMVKSAELPSVLKDALIRGLQGAAIAGVAGLGIGGAAHILGKKQEEDLQSSLENSWEETSSSLKKMTKDNHQLTRNIDYTDPKVQNKAQEVFGALATIAPTIASNPTLARAFLNEAMSLGQGEFNTNSVKTITEIQKNIDNAVESRGPFQTPAFLHGFGKGFKAVGGEEMFAGMARSTTKADQKRRRG